MSNRVVVTGAEGFIGRVLVTLLQQTGRSVLPVTRASLARQSGSSEPVDYADFARWPELLDGADAVVHLAARAHVLREATSDPLAEFRRANVKGTEQLLRAAVECGVPRFVFVSSIGVLGSDSGAQAFRASDTPCPLEPYALSKWEAEQRVAACVAGTGTEAVIVRPPLVYGPGVKGNFLRLLRLVHSGVPLPLAGFEGRRSFVGVENLCGLLVTCTEHPRAAGQTLLVADGEDVTLPGLIAGIGTGLGRPARLFRAPFGLIRPLAKLSGRGGDLARLAGSLRVDDSATRQSLGWRPHVRFADGIRAMTRWYLESRAS